MKTTMIINWKDGTSTYTRPDGQIVTVPTKNLKIKGKTVAISM